MSNDHIDRTIDIPTGEFSPDGTQRVIRLHDDGYRVYWSYEQWAPGGEVVGEIVDTVFEYKHCDSLAVARLVVDKLFDARSRKQRGTINWEPIQPRHMQPDGDGTYPTMLLWMPGRGADAASCSATGEWSPTTEQWEINGGDYRVPADGVSHVALIQAPA